MLIRYQNGNCRVTLSLLDGTKRREYEGAPRPKFPESIDLKITDYCDAGCSYCHERSTKAGQHASYDAILKVVEGLAPGVEIAIGGGNPLDFRSTGSAETHFGLSHLLMAFADRGLISNLTVNQKHFMANCDYLVELQNRGLLFGMGVSVTEPLKELPKIMPVNLVWHVITGVVDPVVFMKRLANPNHEFERMLLLGYKRYGFGVKCNEEAVETNILRWRFWMKMFTDHGVRLSFDTLALEQLCVRERLSPELWGQHFMGEDGEFTMYVDAVRQEFATSSTDTRRSIAGKNIQQMFAEVRNPAPIKITS